MNDKVIEKKSNSQNILIYMASFVIIVAGLKSAESILIPFLLAIFISVISNPLIIYLRSKGSPIVVAIFLVITFIFLLGAGITSIIASSLTDFSENLPKYQNLLKESAANFFYFFEKRGFAISGEAILKRFDPGAALSVTSSILTGLGNVLSKTLLILLMVVFMLLEGTLFRYKLRHVLSNKHDSGNQVDSFSQTVNRYMFIKTCTSLATGVTLTIWLTILGVDYPILWGFITFLFNYVPTVGSIIAAIPPAMLALIELGPISASFVLIGYLVVNVIIGSLLEPRLLGSGLHLSTLVVFLSLIFWGWVFGPVGMVLSVPLTMTIKIALSNSNNTRWISILMDDRRSMNQTID